MDVMPAATTLFSIGDTLRLVASGIDANGHAAAALSVVWTSENDAVASVTATGAGTGEIWVKATRAGPNHIGEAVITVPETGTSSASAGSARRVLSDMATVLLESARQL